MDSYQQGTQDAIQRIGCHPFLAESPRHYFSGYMAQRLRELRPDFFSVRKFFFDRRPISLEILEARTRREK
jgi:hypothetical protein